MNPAKDSPSDVGRLLADSDVLRTLLAAMPGAVFVGEWVEGKGFQYSSAYESPSIERFTGIPPTQLLKKPGSLLDLIHPEDRRQMVDALYRAVHSREDQEVTYRIRHAETGEERWIHERLSSQTTDDQDRTLVIGVMMDITAFYKTEEELKRAQRRMQVLVEGTPYLFFYTQDVKGRVTYVSPSVERITGYSVEEWLGQNHWYITPSQLNEPARRATHAHLRGEPPQGFSQVELRGKSGEVVLLEVYEHPIVEEGEIRGIQGVARDVTEERRLHEALLESQKMEAVGRLAAGLAHDLNNMLQGIMTCGELLSGEVSAGRSRQWTSEILDLSSRGKELVRQLLAYSGRQVLQARPSDLTEIVREAAPLIQRLVGDDIRVVLELAPDLPPIMADASQFGQILLNLASNARDAMPQGGQLTLVTGRVAAPSTDGVAGVFLEVSDEGVGMTADLVAEIFEPYFTTKSRHGGTGLGLASVRGIVTQHRGTIEVDSKPGRGSTFRIQFPVADASLEPEPMHATRKVSRENPVGTASATGRILLVEDNPDVQRAMRDVLQASGYEAVVAESVAEAMETLEMGTVNLLLTDLQLPDGTGLDIITEARKGLNPDLPVVLMSGYARGSLPANIESLPDAVEFLEKPVDIETLLMAIQRAMRP